MNISLGCDHAGFTMKRLLIAHLESRGHQVLDCGAFDETPSDYPDWAQAVAQAILSGAAERGILICGSGVGASIAANKIAGMRAGLCHDCYSSHQGVEHDAMNVLCLGARVVGPALAADIVDAFVGAVFSGEERHQRRLDKIDALEHNFQAGRRN